MPDHDKFGSLLADAFLEMLALADERAGARPRAGRRKPRAKRKSKAKPKAKPPAD